VRFPITEAATATAATGEAAARRGPIAPISADREEVVDRSNSAISKRETAAAPPVMRHERQKGRLKRMLLPPPEAGLPTGGVLPLPRMAAGERMAAIEAAGGEAAAA